MTHAQAQELIGFLFFLKIIISLIVGSWIAVCPFAVAFLWNVVREYRKKDATHEKAVREMTSRARNLGPFSL